jgi:hypothetical protein
MSAKDILCTYIYKTNYKTLPPQDINIFNQIVITGTWGGYLNLNYETIRYTINDYCNLVNWVFNRIL